MKINRWGTVAVAGIACALTACQHQVESAAKPLTPVKAETVRLLPTSGETRYSANITANSQVALSFKNGGYVDQIHRTAGVDNRERLVQEGDPVQQGTVLAQVRQKDFVVKVNQARAQLNQARSSLEAARAQQAEAEAALQQAQLDFDRAKNLFATQSLTKSDFDAAKARLDGSTAKVAAARGQVSASEAQIAAAEESVKDAEIALQDSSLKAPMKAVVLKRSVEVGSLVGPGSPAFSLADTSSVKAVFGVPDTAVRSVRPGMFLNVQTEAIPGVLVQGRVTSISPSADVKSRVFDVEVTIPNPKDEWKIGMIATVAVPGAGPARQAMVLPLTAIVRSNKNPDQYAVFLIEEQAGRQIARLREVRLGEPFGNGITVTEGLKPGQRVISSGSTMVTDGEAVQVLP